MTLAHPPDAADPGWLPPPAHVPGLAHQFDDLGQQHEAAMLGMWAFLATEVLFFGGALAGYAVYRSVYHDAFAAASREESWILGGINTSVLLTSSLTMALAVDAAHTRRSRRTVLWLGATIVLALVFIGIKLYEYSRIIEHGRAPWGDFVFEPAHLAGPARLFFSFYFALTGLHALHMVIGVGVMTWLIARTVLGRSERRGASAVEITGLYWHFVDVVWVFLYPLFYLVSRS